MPPCRWPFAISIHVYMCVCVCTCVCMCQGHPPCPQMPLTSPNHLPPPQSHREPKTAKFNNSWTNRDNWILFEDSLPLNISELIQATADHPRHPPPPAPSPRAEKTQIGRITKTLEWIEIIQFCLKICDPWTLLHTYKLGLLCRWGCPIPNGTFMFWNQKSTSFSLLWASDKNFSCFCTGSH